MIQVKITVVLSLFQKPQKLCKCVYGV